MRKVLEAHETEYECRPDIVATAPGRFHLMGEHSWYFRDKTLSMAVNLPVYISVSLRRDSALRFYFPQLKERKRANLSTLKFRKEDRWANFIKAVIYGFNEPGFFLRGMNIT
ncbi:MAG: galactokinase, partial [Spirochaetaceae bacterium]|nr:galactokinase [Spirochaetaceae bacterium]